MVFRNDLYFLSNMYPCKIKIGSHIFKCSESLFQSFKCPDLMSEFAGMDGRAAKKFGRTVPLRPDWMDIRVECMHEALTQKFQQNPHLLKRLKEIEGEIVEDNNWGDKFWGVCNGSGENVLGQLLMQIRDEL